MLSGSVLFILSHLFWMRFTRLRCSICCEMNVILVTDNVNTVTTDIVASIKQYQKCQMNRPTEESECFDESNSTLHFFGMKIILIDVIWAYNIPWCDRFGFIGSCVCCVHTTAICEKKKKEKKWNLNYKKKWIQFQVQRSTRLYRLY